MTTAAKASWPTWHSMFSRRRVKSRKRRAASSSAGSSLNRYLRTASCSASERRRYKYLTASVSRTVFLDLTLDVHERQAALLLHDHGAARLVAGVTELPVMAFLVGMGTAKVTQRERTPRPAYCRPRS